MPSNKVLEEWPYTGQTFGSDFMTPDMVWSAYLHEHRMRQLVEMQLKYLATRIHNQRIELNRLLMKNDNKKESEDAIE